MPRGRRRRRTYKKRTSNFDKYRRMYRELEKLDEYIEKEILGKTPSIGEMTISKFGQEAWDSADFLERERMMQETAKEHLAS